MGGAADGASAALLEQLTAEQTAVVQGVVDARDEKKNAADEAAALARDISADTAEVAEQRDEAEDVIDDIQKKLKDLIPFSTGRRSDGSWAPQLPSGADNITGPHAADARADCRRTSRCRSRSAASARVAAASTPWAGRATS